MTEIIEFDGKISVDGCLDKIIHGDCLEVMCALPDKCVDVVITSPPYNLLNSGGNGLKKNTNCGKWKNTAIKNGYADMKTTCPTKNTLRDNEIVLPKCAGSSRTTAKFCAAFRSVKSSFGNEAAR